MKLKMKKITAPIIAITIPVLAMFDASSLFCSPSFLATITFVPIPIPSENAKIKIWIGKA